MSAGTDTRAAPATTVMLPAMLLRHAADRPRQVALRVKELGRWREITWGEYAERAAHIGLGLRALGVSAGDRVGVQSDNRPEWLLADLGVQGIGAVTVGVYPTSPEAEVAHVLGHSEAMVLFAEDEEQLDKALATRDRLPKLQKIVVIDTRGIRSMADPLVMSLDELEVTGAQRAASAPSEWADAVGELHAGDLATIVYTSGTTGPPKGAMLSHANLAAAAESTAGVYGARPSDEVLSYLPLCHIAERLVSVVDAVHIGYVVNFGEGGESFLNDLREVQPTFFLGVPRVWEKMLGTVQVQVAEAGWLKRRSYARWQRAGEARARAQLRGGGGSMRPPLLGQLLLYRSLRKKLGLARVRVALSGAAPIAPQVTEYFWSVGVQIRDAYGLTESTGLATATPADDVRLGSVGRALPGVELRLAGDGEILLRGPSIFLGYLTDDAATRAAVDAEGWLLTGDVGELDADGYLTITDRKKDIIITAGGQNISPQLIESMLKLSPYVRDAMVIGDRHPYLTALIGIEIETVGEWAARRDLPFTTEADLAEKREVRELIRAHVERVNRDLADPETIKGFELLPSPLAEGAGQLTATQKVKREVVAAQFATLIEGMYT